MKDIRIGMDTDAKAAMPRVVVNYHIDHDGIRIQLICRFNVDVKIE
jgi:hypothetical protein